MSAAAETGAERAGADGEAGTEVLLLAPLKGDRDVLARLLEGEGLRPLPVGDLETLERVLAEKSQDLCFVVVTHEGASADVGRLLLASFESQPSWALLPVVFLLKRGVTPPAGCRALGRFGGQPPLVLLDRPAREATLRSVFDVQRQVRQRQFQTRDLLDELQAGERRQNFLLSELRHRTRNSMAVLQAMFRLTARRYDDLETFLQVFSDRLNALAAAHSRLSDERAQERDLARLLREHAGAYGGERRHLSLEGPPVVLSSRMAFDLALVAHELATNAAKYGALSVDDGRVAVSWRVAEDLERAGPDGVASGKGAPLEVVWRESGGPRIDKPERRGLGSELIENLAGGTGATSRTDYRADGLVWTATIPAGHYQIGDADPDA